MKEAALGASQMVRKTPARAARGRQKQQGLGFGDEALRAAKASSRGRSSNIV